MPALSALMTRTSNLVPPLPADQLSALLDLFTSEESTAVLAPSARHRLRRGGSGLRARTQTWSRRATEWGAGPGGAWRAW